MHRIKLLYNQIFRRKGLYSFLGVLKRDSSLLDVGCGNDSSYNIKTSFPGFDYTGIDIGDYNQTKPLLADHYLLATAETFAEEISQFNDYFDAVISSHNLEHCDQREKTLRAMLEAVKVGGRLYLSFPCEASVNFPSRKITLNYYDDKTHKENPPSFEKVIKILDENNFSIEYGVRKYRPTALWLIGMIQEPLSRILRKNLQGTWAYYGFETIIWARKKGMAGEGP